MFRLCAGMCALFLLGTVYCAENGVRCIPGVIMAGFWLGLAFLHARR